MDVGLLSEKYPQQWGWLLEEDKWLSVSELGLLNEEVFVEAMVEITDYRTEG